MNARRPATTTAPPRVRPARNRPSGKRAPARTGPTKARANAKGRADVVEPDAPPRQITVRTVVLCLVILVAFIVLAPTLRAYVSQAEQQRDLVAQIEAAQARNADLQRSIDRWDDPAFIQHQARDRLGFVYPGETAYIVVDPETVTGEEVETDPRDEGPVTVPHVGPWYVTVVDSVRVAGEAGSDE